MGAATKNSAGLFCLRIELEDLTPAIWRRVWVDDRSSLSALHHTIQAAMGWTDAHLHEFRIGGVIYAIPHPEDDPERAIVDERRARLRKALDDISMFSYQYDFGDSWQHTITVEKRAPMPEHWHGCAFVEAGERACPPEDSGGPSGYQTFLDQLGDNPKHTEVRKFKQWAGKGFDPRKFDRHAANAALSRMAWNRWGDT